jgi:hypothetical protein
MNVSHLQQHPFVDVLEGNDKLKSGKQQQNQ